MQAKQANLNADMGESYGRYVLGNDEALIPFVGTIHVACGYHAADPGTMLRSVQLAKRFGVELGAHISYPDFMGFGRRRMELSEDEVFEISVYQIGALLGFCRAEGVRAEPRQAAWPALPDRRARPRHRARHRASRQSCRPRPHSPDGRQYRRRSMRSARGRHGPGRICRSRLYAGRFVGPGACQADARSRDHCSARGCAARTGRVARRSTVLWLEIPATVHLRARRWRQCAGAGVRGARSDHCGRISARRAPRARRRRDTACIEIAGR